MNEGRIKEVFTDEKFVEELFSKETPEEVKTLLEEKDIDFSVEDIVKLREILVAKIDQQASGEEGELDEDELEEVAGGIGIAAATIGATAAFIAGTSLLVGGSMYGASCLIFGRKPRW